MKPYSIPLLLVIVLFVSLAAKTVSGREAVSKFVRAAPSLLSAPPAEKEVACPPELSTKSDQDFLVLPEGYTVGSIEWTETKCQGAGIICEYGGVIKIFKDLSDEYSWCQNSLNNFTCSCSPK